MCGDHQNEWGWRIPNITGKSSSTVIWSFSCLTFGFSYLCNSSCYRIFDALSAYQEDAFRQLAVWQRLSQKGISSVDNLFLSPTFTSCPAFFLLCVLLSYSIWMALILSPLIQCSSLFIFYSWGLLYNSWPSEPTAIHTTLTNNLTESDWFFNKEEKWWQKQTHLH